MDSVLRAAALYLVLLVLFRIAGRRSLTDITTFDLLLLMIIGEATQQALLGDDFAGQRGTGDHHPDRHRRRSVPARCAIRSSTP